MVKNSGIIRCVKIRKANSVMGKLQTKYISKGQKIDICKILLELALILTNGIRARDICNTRGK